MIPLSESALAQTTTWEILLELQDLLQTALRLVTILHHPQQKVKLGIIIYSPIFRHAQSCRVRTVDLEDSMGIEC
jgi:hypothetical protein